MSKKRLILLLVDSESSLEEAIDVLAIDSDRDLLVTGRMTAKKFKSFFAKLPVKIKTLSSFNILNMNLVRTLFFSRPEQVVLAVDSSFRSDRFITDLIRLNRFLGINSDIGILDLDSIIDHAALSLLSLTKASAEIDWIVISAALVFLAAAFGVNICLGAVLALILILPDLLLIGRYSLFGKQDSPASGPNSKMFRRKYGFQFSGRSPEKNTDRILWLDMKGLASCEYSQYSFLNAAYQTVSKYEFDANGYKQAAGNKSSVKPGIALMGGSYAFGMYVPEGNTLADLLQKSFPEHNMINAAMKCGASSVNNCLMLGRLFEDNPQLHTVIVFISGYWESTSHPHPKHVIKMEYPIPLYYRKNRRLRISKNLSLHPCITDKLVWGRYAWFGLLTLYRKLVVPGLRHVEITEAALQDIRKQCAEAGRNLLVAVGHGGHYLESFLEESGFYWVDATKVRDGTHLEDNGEKWTFLPVDEHPTVEAQQVMAENIVPALAAVLNSRGFHHESLADKNDVVDYNTEMDVYPLF